MLRIYGQFCVFRVVWEESGKMSQRSQRQALRTGNCKDGRRGHENPRRGEEQSMLRTCASEDALGSVLVSIASSEGKPAMDLLCPLE